MISQGMTEGNGANGAEGLAFLACCISHFERECDANRNASAPVSGCVSQRYPQLPHFSLAHSGNHARLTPFRRKGIEWQSVNLCSHAARSLPGAGAHDRRVSTGVTGPLWISRQAGRVRVRRGRSRDVHHERLWLKGLKEVKSLAGIEVVVNPDEPLEKALRRFKRQCEQSGLRAEMKRHEFYEKPSVKRKRKIENARRNMRRKAKKQDRMR